MEALDKAAGHELEAAVRVRTRRLSPWQDRREDEQCNAARVSPAELLATRCPSTPSNVAADAAGCSPCTDAGLTRSERPLPLAIAAIRDDRLFIIAEISTLLQIRQQLVYAACDRGELEYVKFEGAVQIEGRDLKRWVAVYQG
jgi:hypothetical protein